MGLCKKLDQYKQLPRVHRTSELGVTVARLLLEPWHSCSPSSAIYEAICMKLRRSSSHKRRDDAWTDAPLLLIISATLWLSSGESADGVFFLWPTSQNHISVSLRRSPRSLMSRPPTFVLLHSVSASAASWSLLSVDLHPRRSVLKWGGRPVFSRRTCRLILVVAWWSYVWRHLLQCLEWHHMYGC